MRPAWEQLAEQHHARAAQTGDALEGYLATVAEYAGQRTAELGVEVAAAPPAWAIEWLGPLPDPDADPAGHAEWVRGAGQVAAYREWRGIPDEQISIGQAPPPAQQLAHELWLRAAETGSGDPRVVDWRKASDAELREALALWERQQQTSPVSVANERGEAIALAHDATNEATIGRAQLAVMDINDPARVDVLRRIDMQEVMAEQFVSFVAGLDDAHGAREAWWEQTRDIREAAYGATHELARRGLPTDPTQLEPEQPGQRRRTHREPGPRRRPGRRRAGGPTSAARSAVAQDQQQAFDLDLDSGERGVEQRCRVHRGADGRVAGGVRAAPAVPRRARRRAPARPATTSTPTSRCTPRPAKPRSASGTSSSSAPSCAPSTGSAWTPTGSSPTSTSPTPAPASSPKRNPRRASRPASTPPRPPGDPTPTRSRPRRSSRRRRSSLGRRSQPGRRRRPPRHG